MQLTRRSVLKAVAAVLMAPTVTLRKTVDREAILRAFVDDDACTWRRYNLSQPVTQEGHVWATNGRELVRTFDDGFLRDGGEDRVPPVADVWDTLYRPSAFSDFRLPRIEELTHRTTTGNCPLCNSRRVSYGPHYPEMDCPIANVYDWDVDDNTIRDRSCPLCEGKYFNGPNALLIHGLPFSYSRVAKLALVPNCRTSLSVGRQNTNSEYASGPLLCFTGDGFSGLAMPLIDAEKC